MKCILKKEEKMKAIGQNATKLNSEISVLEP